MNGKKVVYAVERVVRRLHRDLQSEYQSPMGGVEERCEWCGEDFHRLILTTPAGSLHITATSVVGEEGANVRVVVVGPQDCSCAVHGHELARIARVVAADPAVTAVWPDSRWPKTFLVAVRTEGLDS